MKIRFLSFSSAVLPLLLLSGCSWLGDVSSNMRVDTGLEPKNVDSNVRFRTTYYFRVLTGCRIDTMASGDRADDNSPFAKRVKGEFVPLNDSLYRFRMTGQAAALFNRVHFESGVLRKEQIDPFGSTVRYNEQTHAFTPISADEVRADNARHAAMQDIEQFRKLYTDLAADEKLTAEHRTQLFTKLVVMIEDRLDQIKASRPQDGAISTAPTSGLAGTSPTDTALVKLEQKLSDTEAGVANAKIQLGNAQNTLNEAQKKVAVIKTNLNHAKAALASQSPQTDEDTQKVSTLLAELTAAEQALNEAETNRNTAYQLVTELTGKSMAVQTTIEQAHQKLTTARQDTTTSLTILRGKVEDLLKELGTSITPPQTNPDTKACGGKPSENKYYLLGPEGAKELDPNDRLLLALSVDSKPLISALQQLSDRKFQSAGTNYQVTEDLLQERGHILDSRLILQKAEKAIGQDTEIAERKNLKMLLDELRKPYVTRNATSPTK